MHGHLTMGVKTREGLYKLLEAVELKIRATTSWEEAERERGGMGGAEARRWSLTERRRMKVGTFLMVL